MILETVRLQLREFTLEDAEAFWETMGDVEVMRFSVAGRALTLEETRNTIQAYLNSYNRYGYGPWAVIHQEDRKLIGYCGLFHHEVDGQSEVELSYRLAKQYWNQGLGTEMALAVRDYALQVLKIDRLISLIDPENVSSLHIAQKIGMQFQKITYFNGIVVHQYRLDF